MSYHFHSLLSFSSPGSCVIKSQAFLSSFPFLPLLTYLPSYSTSTCSRHFSFSSFSFFLTLTSFLSLSPTILSLFVFFFLVTHLLTSFLDFLQLLNLVRIRILLLHFPPSYSFPLHFFLSLSSPPVVILLSSPPLFITSSLPSHSRVARLFSNLFYLFFLYVCVCLHHIP